MSAIITFMFEPAKLQMNWASARGRINLRGDSTALPGIMASLAATGFSVMGLHTCTRVGEQPLPLLGVTRERALGSARNLPLGPDPLTKLSEAVCNCVRVRQVRLRTLVEESEDRGGECFA
jgi:hypothetical protein